MTTPVQQDVRALADMRRVIERAENAGDPEPIIELLADDAVAMVPDFEVQEGRDACAAFLRHLLPGLLQQFDRRITCRSAEVRVLDEVAFDRGTFAFGIRPKSGGAVERVTGKYFWMYERDAAGEWKLSRMIVSRDEAAQPEPSRSSGTLAAALGVGVIALALGYVVVEALREPESDTAY